jgi:hypothetical protein
MRSGAHLLEGFERIGGFAVSEAALAKAQEFCPEADTA